MAIYSSASADDTDSTTYQPECIHCNWVGTWYETRPEAQKAMGKHMEKCEKAWRYE